MKSIITALLAFALLPLSAFAAGESNQGAADFRSFNCTSCHGPEGKHPILSHYPKLAGLSKEYVVQQLKDFRSGARTHGTGKIMNSIVRTIPETVYDGLGEYLAGFAAVAGDSTGKDNSQSKGAQAFVARNCHTCHGEGGAAPTAPNYPKLAGQNAKYLLGQMNAIKSGDRSNGMSMVMKAMVAEVPEEDFNAIAEYLQGAKK